MTIGDKMVVVMRGNQAGVTTNDIENVFAYEVTTGSGSSEDLFNQFAVMAVDHICPILHSSFAINLITVINLDDVSDFDIEPVVLTGLQGSQFMPPFVSFTFEYVRDVRGINNGRKAFGPIAENDVDNGIANADALSRLLPLADELGGTLTGTDGAYTPRIWRRAGNYAPYSGTPRVGTPYPDTFYPISGVTFSGVSTQSTRKR